MAAPSLQMKTIFFFNLSGALNAYISRGIQAKYDKYNYMEVGKRKECANVPLTVCFNGAGLVFFMMMMSVVIMMMMMAISVVIMAMMPSFCSFKFIGGNITSSVRGSQLDNSHLSA